MEPYKQQLMIGAGLLVLSALTACIGNIPFVSVLPLVAGVMYIVKGIKMGKHELFTVPEEEQRREIEEEQNSKIRVVIDTITGCREDEARNLLNEYNWDEVKIYMEFKNDPERFYGKIRGVSSYMPVNSPIPITVSNDKKCSLCGNIYPDSLQYCPSCEVTSARDSRGTQPLENIGEEKKCPSCGTMVARKLAYCTECGRKF